MHYLDSSFGTPEENLAWDEALIELAHRTSSPSSGSERSSPSSRSELSSSSSGSERSSSTSEVLRWWSMPTTCVVLGRSSRIDAEVQPDRCREDGIPILRRMSGGAPIVAGPGCCMYSLLLSLEARPECRQLDEVHRMVMDRTRSAMQSALIEHGLDRRVEIQGICDLTVDDQKISGNALRVKKDWILYHGTLLIDMPLEWIDAYLAMPQKQPEYRRGRPHAEFVTSLKDSLVDPSGFTRRLSRCMQRVWNATEPWSTHVLREAMPHETQRWLAERYTDPKWHSSR